MTIRTECLDKRIPWFVWGAIEHSKAIVRDYDCVLEWGCGGSTLFWLDSGLRVVTVEHDPKWMRVVRGVVDQTTPSDTQARWTPVLSEPGVNGRVQSRRHAGTFDRYVGFARDAGGILREAGCGKLLVCVDGRARNECVQAALELDPACVVLDNVDRPDYAPAVRQLLRWSTAGVTFRGTGPQGGSTVWETTFFEKR